MKWWFASLALASLFVLASCGNDCPTNNGVVTNPSCPGYNPYYAQPYGYQPYPYGQQYGQPYAPYGYPQQQTYPYYPPRPY